MSTRRLLNITTGAVALLFVGAAVLSWTGGGGTVDPAALELVAGQDEALAELRRDAKDLATAADLADVNAARERLGQDILRFDRRLSALINGGTVALADGTTVSLEAVRDEAAHRALVRAAATWRGIGVPLADLAAGAYSAYSAAGQSALSGLESGGPQLAEELAEVEAAFAEAGGGGSGRAAWLRGTAVGLILLLAGLVVLRRLAPLIVPDVSAAVPSAAPAAAPAATPVVKPIAPRAPLPGPPAGTPPQPYTSPVDLEDVSLAVDRLALDMNSIATNSDKMRAAIDSVGHALQGMLFSLKEMAKDTAEGERLVGGARSAATYTRDVTEALGESVREMSAVVAAVSELARRTRATAEQIAKDAARGDRTGKGFTPAVSNEVRGLALRTGAATAEVEETVSDMLARTREYEEAIGEILQHVSVINRVSQELGRVMLDPPAPSVVPAPSILAAADAPAEDLGEVTAAAIADATEALADNEADGAASDTEPSAAKRSAEPESEEPAAATPGPVEEPTVETFSLDSGSDAEPASPEPAERPKVFVLSKPSPASAEAESASKPAAPEPAAAPEPSPEPEAAAAPEPAPEPADEVVEVDTAELEEALENPVEPEPAPEATPEDVADPEPTPEPAAEPEVAAEPEPVAEAEPAPEPDPGDEPAVAEGASPNIFMLNAPDTPPAPAPAAEDEEDDEVDDDFMIGGPEPAEETVPPREG